MLRSQGAPKKKGKREKAFCILKSVSFLADRSVVEERLLVHVCDGGDENVHIYLSFTSGPKTDLLLYQGRFCFLLCHCSGKASYRSVRECLAWLQFPPLTGPLFYFSTSGTCLKLHQVNQYAR